MSLCSVVAVAALVVAAALPAQQAPADSLALVRMVDERAVAMNHRDLATLARQYAPDMTFINTAGFYFGPGDMARFDSVLVAFDSTRYRSGRVQVRLLDSANALVYYGWRVDRFRAVNPTLNELGLLTLSAQKRNGQWRWVAATNQATPTFVDDLLAHRRPASSAPTRPPAERRP